MNSKKNKWIDFILRVIWKWY